MIIAHWFKYLPTRPSGFVAFFLLPPLAMLNCCRKRIHWQLQWNGCNFVLNPPGYARHQLWLVGLDAIRSIRCVPFNDGSVSSVFQSCQDKRQYYTLSRSLRLFEKCLVRRAAHVPLVKVHHLQPTSVHWIEQSNCPLIVATQPPLTRVGTKNPHQPRKRRGKKSLQYINVAIMVEYKNRNCSPRKNKPESQYAQRLPLEAEIVKALSARKNITHHSNF